MGGYGPLTMQPSAKEFPSAVEFNHSSLKIDFWGGLFNSIAPGNQFSRPDIFKETALKYIFKFLNVSCQI